MFCLPDPIGTYTQELAGDALQKAELVVRFIGEILEMEEII